MNLVWEGKDRRKDASILKQITRRSERGCLWMLFSSNRRCSAFILYWMEFFPHVTRTKRREFGLELISGRVLKTFGGELDDVKIDYSQLI